MYAGNTADATTLMPEVAKLRADCGLERLARGTLKSEAAIGVRVGRVVNKYKVGWCWHSPCGST